VHFSKHAALPKCVVNKIYLEPGHCTLGIHAVFQMVKFYMGIQYRTCVVIVSMVLQRRRTLNTGVFTLTLETWNLHILDPPANTILMAASTTATIFLSKKERHTITKLDMKKNQKLRFNGALLLFLFIILIHTNFIHSLKHIFNIPPYGGLLQNFMLQYKIKAFKKTRGLMLEKTCWWEKLKLIGRNYIPGVV